MKIEGDNKKEVKKIARQKNRKYQEILEQKINEEKNSSKRTRYEMTLVCGQYMPYLVEGECPNCGLKLAIHDYCIRLKCPVCEVTIEV
jgi:hypothetical protein